MASSYVTPANTRLGNLCGVKDGRRYTCRRSLCL